MSKALGRLQLFLAETNPKDYRSIRGAMQRDGLPVPPMHGEDEGLSIDGQEAGKAFKDFVVAVLEEVLQRFNSMNTMIVDRMKRRKKMAISASISTVIGSLTTAITVASFSEYAYIPAAFTAISSILTLIADGFGVSSERFWNLRDEGNVLAARAELLLAKYQTLGDLNGFEYNDENVAEIDEIVIGLKAIISKLEDEGYA